MKVLLVFLSTMILWRNLCSFLLITLTLLLLPMEFPQDGFSTNIFNTPSVASYSRSAPSLLVSACGKNCKKHVVAIETKKVIPVPVPYPVYPKKKKCCKKKKHKKALVVTVPDKCCKKNKGCCGGGFGNYYYNYYDYLAPPLFYDYSYYDYYGGGGGGDFGIGGALGTGNGVGLPGSGIGSSFGFGKKKK